MLYLVILMSETRTLFVGSGEWLSLSSSSSSSDIGCGRRGATAPMPLLFGEKDLQKNDALEPFFYPFKFKFATFLARLGTFCTGNI